MVVTTTRSSGQKFTTCDGIPSDDISGTVFDAYYAKPARLAGSGMSVVKRVGREADSELTVSTGI